MGSCPECKFDGTNGKPNENRQFPDGFASESRLVVKGEKREGELVQVMVRNSNGSPKWGIRYRCPLCGHTDDKVSKSKKQTDKEVAD